MLIELDAGTRRAQERSQRVEGMARDLLAEGLAGEAIEVLSTLARCLVAHEPGGALPCLCRRCGFEGFEAEAGGERFVRDFVVVGGRSLHYWAPASLGARRGLERLRRSMRVSLQATLNELLKARRPPIDSSNPRPPLPPELARLLETIQDDVEIPF